jgi:hypothetical protein
MARKALLRFCWGIAYGSAPVTRPPLFYILRADPIFSPHLLAVKCKPLFALSFSQNPKGRNRGSDQEVEHDRLPTSFLCLCLGLLFVSVELKILVVAICELGEMLIRGLASGLSPMFVSVPTPIPDRENDHQSSKDSRYDVVGKFPVESDRGGDEPCKNNEGIVHVALTEHVGVQNLVLRLVVQYLEDGDPLLSVSRP